MGYRVVMDAGAVQAWSMRRLPFEPAGWLLDFRRDLREACRALVAGKVRGAARGLQLGRPQPRRRRERAGLQPRHRRDQRGGTLGPGPGAVLRPVDDEHAAYPHHYRYLVSDREAPWAHWTPGAPLASLTAQVPPTAFHSPRAGSWWWHARLGSVTAARTGKAVPELVALRVRVAPYPNWRATLAGLVKPMTDGLVAAMHAHDGPVDDDLARRIAATDPELLPARLRELLGEPGPAPLSRVRLVAPWGNTVQWHPADDRIVALDVRIATELAPGTVLAEASLPQPA